VRLERTFDVAEVKSIIGHPELKPLLVEGDEIPVPLHPSIYYLVAKKERFADGAVDDYVVGIAAFIPVNSITWNPHVAILPAHRGNGTQVLRMAMSWMFANTPCTKIVAYPPSYNEAMIRVFDKCGFSTEGLSPKSFEWRGAVHDRILMGIEKENTPCGQG
jgi:RimJ/RimL family protein N-acetyltransferase